MCRFWQAFAGACALALATTIGISDASAAGITYEVHDHPDGALNCRNKPASQKECYMLRLNEWHTFTADAPGTGVFFEYTPGEENAYIFGTVKHNQGGGLYEIFATLVGIVLEDGGPTNWYSPNADDEAYNDMLADLEENSDATRWNDPYYRTNLDRIYFSGVDLTLDWVEGTPSSFNKSKHYDEYPNSPNKRFFIQKNHRNSADLLAAAGWLERYPNRGAYGTNDFLFTMWKAPPSGTSIPEPTTGLLLTVGLGALTMVGMRRRLARTNR